MKRKYFGTDGVRGKVGEKITPEFALKLGWAAGKVLASHNQNSRVLIGKDTRISCYMLESALEAGFAAAGVASFLTGPMPTPAISYLTRTFRMDAGVVISASHNPYYDNGIKFFNSDGTKLPDEVELEIEKYLELPLECVDNVSLGRAKRVVDAVGRYIEFCKASFSTRFTLKGLKVVVDCANGATYHIAPSVFQELGAEVIAIANQPNGININENCGSTHLNTLINKVLDTKADLGIAFDGDGDRVMMVTSEGQVVDGDQILYILAAYEHATNKLAGKGVVGTLMSNNGLLTALDKLNIPFVRSAVGDRYVLQKLLDNGWYLGGENSGHIIHLNKNQTGDGIIAALAVLRSLTYFNKSLGQMVAQVPLFPQILINVRIDELENNVVQKDSVQQLIKAIEESIAPEGRVLLRVSGTEPIIRVMVEHPEETIARQACEELVEEIKKYKK
ncbi:phosphoglucosamine mutase [Psittacicella melopsittaci]|uniref:Phosphoglucosamine mutase n=1 Tax=Psittacicella melopsittaci TaxID=2028576 RepID=A0A3A1Y057_9GAMM|nr:phosphoglucosamine mutase [Psittacicella melopsittaci]RIY31633.1 phosphoglucosamine mutase [Psittacicella melopsittaci]